jgi:alginate O-acetyltransferase complex protein AlgI
MARRLFDEKGLPSAPKNRAPTPGLEPCVLFNSLQFWFFFAVFAFFYFRLKHQGQNRLILVGSYIFYGAWDWRFVGLLILTTAIDWFVALRISDAPDRPHKKRWLAVSITTDLSILGFFKYYNFFTESLVALASQAGVTLEPSLLRVILPVGISFYTFQSLAYTVDVFRGRVSATRSLLEYAVYVAFFPQLVAGPIERGWHMLQQVQRNRHVTRENVAEGVYLISWGLFKKVFIADNLSKIVTAVFEGPGPHDGLTTLIAVYAFAFQIYCDFSGYTDIARGLARTMGFSLLLNFNLPYLATNPSEFWRRWHISLSTWLRDYLYIPLGGNRKGTSRTYVNLMITMLLGGLWHGAAWTFVIWGAYHGLLLCVHRALRPVLASILQARSVLGAALSRGVRTFVMFHLVCVGWIFFRARSLGQVTEFLSSLAGGLAWSERGQYYLSCLVGLIGFLLIVQLFQAIRRDLLILHRPRGLWLRATLYLYLYCSMLFLGNLGAKEFIYFQF